MMNQQATTYKDVLKVCLELEFQPDIIPYKCLVDMIKAKRQEDDSKTITSTEKNLYKKIQRDAKACRLFTVHLRAKYLNSRVIDQMCKFEKGTGSNQRKRKISFLIH